MPSLLSILTRTPKPAKPADAADSKAPVVDLTDDQVNQVAGGKVDQVAGENSWGNVDTSVPGQVTLT